MKILFFLLAMVNIAYFMWEVRKGKLAEPPIASELSNTVTQEPIVLVSELPKSNSKHEATIPVSDSANICYLAGPFSNQYMSRKWLRNFAIDPATVKSSSKNDLAIDGYVVFYPAPENMDMDMAQENIKMLKQHGVTDLWVYNSGEEKGEVALGSFDLEDRALKMQVELQAKGINAEVKPKFKSKVQYYLELKGNKQQGEAMRSQNDSYPQVNVEVINHCEGGL